jgi:hypothetical protein
MPESLTRSSTHLKVSMVIGPVVVMIKDLVDLSSCQ